MGTVALFIILFVSLLFISCSSSTRSEYEMKLLYEGWLVEHHKNYNDLVEKAKRYEIFKDNLKYIDEHNGGNHPYQLGLNVFADLTVDEYQNNDLSFNPLSKMNMTYKVSNRHMLNKGEELKLPNSVDWREKGAVTHVKNQGKCNSSWAFTTIATIESLNKIVTGELISLSEQELIDCYRKGCGRDDPVKAFQFIIQNQGIDTAEDYPYKAVYRKCDLSKKKKKVVSINGYVLGPFNDENAMKEVVANQPVIGGVDSKSRAFQLYHSGVFTGSCGIDINHAITIIGYGEVDSKDFWLIKNSWGTSWGQKGYMRIARNINKCGIAKYLSYPTKKLFHLRTSGNQFETRMTSV